MSMCYPESSYVLYITNVFIRICYGDNILGYNIAVHIYIYVYILLHQDGDLSYND